MSTPISKEDLMRYLDGELSPGERSRVDDALARSTELQRELAIFRRMQEDLARLAEAGDGRNSVWGSVNRRLTRPVGWVILVVGFVLWAGYGAWVFATSPVNPIRKLAVGAITVGFLVLLAAAILDRVQEWRSDPYRDVER